MTLELYHVAILKCSNCMLNKIEHTNMYGIIRMFLDATVARHVRRRSGVKQNTSMQIYAYMYLVTKVHVHCTRHIILGARRTIKITNNRKRPFLPMASTAPNKPLFGAIDAMTLHNTIPMTSGTKSWQKQRHCCLHLLKRSVICVV
jgi:hypothetical protein